MPFSSPQQELFLKINHPDLWRKWYNEHGHAKGYKEYLRKNKRRKKVTSKQKQSKRRKKKR
jgi:hypothetical protein